MSDMSSTWGLEVIVGFKVEVAEETGSPVKVSSLQLQGTDIMRQLADNRDTMSILQFDAISNAHNGSIIHLQRQFTGLAVNYHLSNS